MNNKDECIKTLYNNLGEIEDKQLNSTFQERNMTVENSNIAFRAYLKKKLKINKNNSIQLIASQRGSGITTELKKLKAELENEKYIVAYCPLKELINTGDTHYVDILLAMLKAVSDELSAKEIYYNYTSLGDVNLSDLKDLIPFKGLDFKVKFSMISEYIKNSDYLKEKTRSIFDKQALAFFDSCNKTLANARKALKDSEYKDIILIVDDFNKLATSSKEEYDIIDRLFIKNKEAFECPGINIILNLPLYKAFEEKDFSYQALWGEDFIIFAQQCIGENGCQQFEQLIKLVRKRLQLSNCEVFATEDLNEFVKCSGGNLNQLFSLIRQALLLTEELPVTLETVSKAISLKKHNLKRPLKEEDFDNINMLKSSINTTDRETFLRYLKKNYLFFCAQSPEKFILNPLFY